VLELDEPAAGEVGGASTQDRGAQRPRGELRQTGAPDVTESAVLALGGGIAGIGLAIAGTRLLEQLVPAGLPGSSLRIDARVLIFSLAVTAATALLFGVIPAWRSAGADTSDGLRDGGRGDLGGRSRWIRNALVVSEVALALVLLVGAALMIETLQNLRRAETGFQRENLLTLRLAISPAKNPDAPARSRFYEAVLERVRALPGRSVRSIRRKPAVHHHRQHHGIPHRRPARLRVPGACRTRCFAPSRGTTSRRSARS
jgi:hypothetical protein